MYYLIIVLGCTCIYCRDAENGAYVTVYVVEVPSGIPLALKIPWRLGSTSPSCALIGTPMHYLEIVKG